MPVSAASLSTILWWLAYFVSLFRIPGGEIETRVFRSGIFIWFSFHKNITRDFSTQDIVKMANDHKAVIIYCFDTSVQYIPRNMHTVFALLCFVAVIHWLISPYPSGLLHWHCGNLTIAPVPAKQPWWIWINTSCEFIMNDCITTTKQSTTKPCAYFLGYTVSLWWKEPDKLVYYLGFYYLHRLIFVPYKALISQHCLSEIAYCGIHLIR